MTAVLVKIVSTKNSLFSRALWVVHGKNEERNMYFTGAVAITASVSSTAVTTPGAAFLFRLDDIISRGRKSFLLFLRPAGGGLFRFVRTEVLDVDFPALSCFVSCIATAAVIILCDGDGD